MRNSKWSYLCCGVNIAFSFVGALIGSFWLLAIGIVFAIVNWYAAELRREIEKKELLAGYGVVVVESGVIEFKKNEGGDDNGQDDKKDTH